MVRIIVREEFRKKPELKPMSPNMKSAVNVANTVLTAVEMLSSSKPVRVARLLKELLDIFTKR